MTTSKPDVQALIERIETHLLNAVTMPEDRTAQLLVDAVNHLSALSGETETGWEYGTVAAAFGGEPEVGGGTLEAALHVQHFTDTVYKKWTHGSEVSIFRRRKAGTWEVVV